jgi:uridine kinase
LKSLANAGASTEEIGDECLMIVAITGASGSGKSTLAQSLVKSRLGVASGPAACLLSLDAYYRDLSHLSLGQREGVNFDRIEAIDLPLFCEHLSKLKSGGQIEVPRYDFSKHTRIADHTDVLGPAQVVVVDGLLLGAWAELTSNVDYTIFVDTPTNVCLQRRLQRDCGERGRSEASVHEFWNSRVLPEFQRWGEGAQRRADLVVSGEVPTAVATAEVWDALPF